MISQAFYAAAPIGDILTNHGIQYSIYTNDTHAYLPFKPDEFDISVHPLESCLEEVRQWIAKNWLYLNDSKYE